AGPGLAPAIRYNLGNAAFQQRQYEAAADAYRKVLEQRPDDEAARRNLELALPALKREQEQQKQQAKQENQQKPASKQDKTKPDDKRQNRKDESRQALKERKDESQSQPKEDASSDNAQAAKDADPKKPGAPSGEGKIGKKEAERLLDSLAQEEKK